MGFEPTNQRVLLTPAVIVRAKYFFFMNFAQNYFLKNSTVGLKYSWQIYFANNYFLSIQIVNTNEVEEIKLNEEKTDFLSV